MNWAIFPPSPQYDDYYRYHRLLFAIFIATIVMSTVIIIQ